MSWRRISFPLSCFVSSLTHIKPLSSSFSRWLLRPAREILVSKMAYPKSMMRRLRSKTLARFFPHSADQDTSRRKWLFLLSIKSSCQQCKKLLKSELWSQTLPNVRHRPIQSKLTSANGLTRTNGPTLLFTPTIILIFIILAFPKASFSFQLCLSLLLQQPLTSFHLLIL